MKKLAWTTVQRKVNDLVPQEINPRKISDKQLKDLMKSFKKFNLVEIPAIDLNGKILAGHQRIKVLQLLDRGEELIDVRVPNRKLTEQESKEYLISSNALGGDWDFDLLKTFELDMLIDLGFDEVKLSKEWDDNKVKEEHFDEEKEIQKIKTPKTKLGDEIYLGRHKLICGDATNLDNVKKLVGNTKVNMINQDPPFNINLSYNKGVGGKKSKRNYGGKVNDNLSDEEYKKKFIGKMLQNALMVSKENVHVFYWCDERYVWLLQTLYKEFGVKNKRLCIWIKNNSSPTPQVAFNKVTEFCCYGTVGSPYLAENINNLNEVQNIELTGGNEMFDDIQNIFLNKRLSSDKYGHPTEKPPELHHKAIKRCTKINDVVLDLTAGSGSILIACEQLGRVAYVNELNPIFCDLIVKRWESFTGKKAIYEKKSQN